MEAGAQAVANENAVDSFEALSEEEASVKEVVLEVELIGVSFER